MFTNRSNQQEIMDDLSLNSDELRKNLRELHLYNKWLGGEKVLIAGLNQIYKKNLYLFKNKTIVIADLGCGGGELLLTIAEWAKTKNIKIEIIGIDANPCMIDYASKNASNENVHYKMMNVFSDEFRMMQFDIVTINSVCHHFDDESLILLFKNLIEQVNLAILINDLHRHWMSYSAIKLMTRLFNFSSLAKHDAPLSVLRAFRKNELIALFQKANVSSYQIRWAWPFRFEAILWSPQSAMRFAG